MRNSKKIMLTAFLCSAVSSLVVGGVALGNTQPVVEAKAEAISTFLVQDAGFIRVKDPVGIRFATTIDEATATKVADLTDVSYGTLLIPTDSLTGELTKETAKVLDVEAKMLQSNVYTGVLVGEDNGDGTYANLPESYYNRPISARGYVTGKDGETTVTYYTNNTVSKSIGYVAKMTEMDPEATMTELLTTIVSKTAIVLDMSDINLSLLKVANNALAVSDNTQTVANATFTIGGVAISDATVTYEIADNTVAKLAEDNKTVVAVADGTTTITATCVYDEKTYTVTKNITVKDTADATPITVDTMIDATWAIAVPEAYGALTAIKNGDAVVSDTNGALTETYVTAKTAGTEETLTFVTENGEYNVPVNYVKTAYTALDHTKFGINTAYTATYVATPTAFANRPNAYLYTNATTNQAPWSIKIGGPGVNYWSQSDYVALDMYLQLPAGATADRIVVHNGAAMAHIAFKTNTGYFVVSDQGYEYTTIPTDQWVTLFVPIAKYALSQGNAFYLLIGKGGASNTGENGSVYIDNVRFYNERQYQVYAKETIVTTLNMSALTKLGNSGGYTYTSAGNVHGKTNVYKHSVTDATTNNVWGTRVGINAASTYYANSRYLALDFYCETALNYVRCLLVNTKSGYNKFVQQYNAAAGGSAAYPALNGSQSILLLDSEGKTTTFTAGKWITMVIDLDNFNNGVASDHLAIGIGRHDNTATEIAMYYANLRVYTEDQYDKFVDSFANRETAYHAAVGQCAATVAVEGTYQVKAMLCDAMVPVTGVDYTVSYASSDTTKATVDATTGVVTGVAAGTTTITATITVGEVTYTALCWITVS